MNTEHSASVIIGMANTLMLYSRNSETIPDYKLRIIMDAVPEFTSKKDLEVAENLLHKYFLGYVDVNIDLTGIDGPICRFNMNKPS